MNEIKSFTASDLTANLQSKIRTLIAESMPDEAINELINQEIKNYFQPRIGQWSGKIEEESKFKKLVETIVNQEMNSKISAELAVLTNNFWVNNGIPLFNEHMKEKVEELAPIMMRSYFESMTASMINAMNMNRPTNTNY